MIDRRTMLGLLAAAFPVAAYAKPARSATLTVYKSPSCGCCSGWVDHIKASGIAVRVVEMEDVTPMAKKLGVPDAMRSCHTGEIGGYFIEGHVPAADIRKLLRERPAARGIALPGMPVGAPGMEQGARRDPYATMIVSRVGKPTLIVRHNQSQAS